MLISACPEPCGKRRFPDRSAAKLAAIHAALQHGSLRVWYRAPECGVWHLTSKISSRKRRAQADKIRPYLATPKET